MSREFIDNGHTRLAIKKSAPQAKPNGQLFRQSQLMGLHPCGQVAAVCYRIGRYGIEFLLVKTRGGRWIFPKGGVEPGLSNAQAAALEAFEEAGVHGRMEDAAFACYVRYEDGEKQKGITTSAHLCEVYRLRTPRESKRRPTWYSPEKAKRRLLEGRREEDGKELSRVVDLAVLRIQKPDDEAAHPPDALQKVQFESRETIGFHQQTEQASFFGYVRRQRTAAGLPASDLSVNGYLHKILRLAPAGYSNGSGAASHRPKPIVPQLTAGTSAPQQNVTAIDHPRRKQEILKPSERQERKP